MRFFCESFFSFITCSYKKYELIECLCCGNNDKSRFRERDWIVGNGIERYVFKGAINLVFR